MSNVNSSPDVRAKVNGESVSLLGGQIVSTDQSSVTDRQITMFIIVVGYEKMDNFAQNAIFLPFFKLLPFQGLESPRLLAWFISSFGLLLHRSNVRSYSKPSGELPK